MCILNAINLVFNFLEYLKTNQKIKIKPQFLKFKVVQGIKTNLNYMHLFYPLNSILNE